MSTTLWALTVGLAMQAGPYDAGAYAPAQPEYPGAAVPYDAYSQQTGGTTEPRYPFDSQEAWVHGYVQEIPAYGGYARFRPYNYKHVLSQSQVSGGWGMHPTMPYSQQFWHRYQDRASMLKTPGAADPVIPTVPPYAGAAVQAPWQPGGVPYYASGVPAQTVGPASYAPAPPWQPAAQYAPPAGYPYSR